MPYEYTLEPFNSPMADDPHYGYLIWLGWLCLVICWQLFYLFKNYKSTPIEFIAGHVSVSLVVLAVTLGFYGSVFNPKEPLNKEVIGHLRDIVTMSSGGGMTHPAMRRGVTYTEYLRYYVVEHKEYVLVHPAHAPGQPQTLKFYWNPRNFSAAK